MSDVHFEIFRQQGKGGGWALVEALEDREGAIKRAKLLLQEGYAAAVRVVKETYHSGTGDYVSLTIFEKVFTATSPSLVSWSSRKNCFPRPARKG